MNIKAISNNVLVSVSAQKPIPKGTILHNMNGSSETSPRCKNCGSWINHWHSLSDLPIPDDGDCAVLGCDGYDEEGNKLPMEGCHVRIVGSEDEFVYIAPLCKSCNSKHGKDLILKRNITLVRANVAETCSKLIVEA